MTGHGVVKSQRPSRMTTVADAMLTAPKRCDPTATVGDLRRFFADPHVHSALVVAHDRLLTVLDRADLPVSESDRDGESIKSLGALTGRVVLGNVELATARRLMDITSRRRLAVVDANGCRIGLLCLKGSGNGFCTDDDVAARHSSQ
jgi:predicted transcriptional regulator